jgi:competence ComEA-like helix-hairpin-helix protein
LRPERHAGILLVCCVLLTFVSLLAALCARHVGSRDRFRPDVAPARFRVDINRAGPPTLCLLPGIGACTADRIVSHRERRGRFDDLHELTRVTGVGPVTVQRIRTVAYCGAGSARAVRESKVASRGEGLFRPRARGVDGLNGELAR